MQVEEQVNRDLRKDQRVGVVGRGLFWVVGEHGRLDEALDIRGTEQLLAQAEERYGKRHVQLHTESRRGQDQPADRRRVVMDPCRRDHGAKAVGEDHGVGQFDAMRGAEVVHPFLDVADHGRQVRRRATLSG